MSTTVPVSVLLKRVTTLEAENAKLQADVIELTRKGEALCCQNGNLLMDNAKLQARIAVLEKVREAAKGTIGTMSLTMLHNQQEFLKDALEQAGE